MTDIFDKRHIKTTTLPEWFFQGLVELGKAIPLESVHTYNGIKTTTRGYQWGKDIFVTSTERKEV